MNSIPSIIIETDKVVPRILKGGLIISVFFSKKKLKREAMVSIPNCIARSKLITKPIKEVFSNIV
ncbi:hypothetical protein protein [Bacillus cereus G9241]|nr:hypothetical protein protein [Bacillus cereus G9241]